MRMYTDSADAIKAYAEEVGFDYNQCKVTEHQEGEKYQRGGLTLEFKNFHKEDMRITIIHNWGDLFDVTFYTEGKGSSTLEDQYFNEILGLFKSLKIALTGVTREEWEQKLEEE